MASGACRVEQPAPRRALINATDDDIVSLVGQQLPDASVLRTICPPPFLHLVRAIAKAFALGPHNPTFDFVHLLIETFDSFAGNLLLVSGTFRNDAIVASFWVLSDAAHSCNKPVDATITLATATSANTCSVERYLRLCHLSYSPYGSRYLGEISFGSLRRLRFGFCGPRWPYE